MPRTLHHWIQAEREAGRYTGQPLAYEPPSRETIAQIMAQYGLPEAGVDPMAGAGMEEMRGPLPQQPRPDQGEAEVPLFPRGVPHPMIMMR